MYYICGHLQLLHPRETEMYRESVAAMRKIGRDCIEKRINAVISGEEVPNDILTQILRTSSECSYCNHIVYIINYSLASC